MSKQKAISGKTIAIIVVIVLVLIVGWYLISNSSSGNSASKKSSSTNPDVPSSDSIASDTIDQTLQGIDNVTNDVDLNQDFSFNVD